MAAAAGLQALTVSTAPQRWRRRSHHRHLSHPYSAELVLRQQQSRRAVALALANGGVADPQTDYAYVHVPGLAARGETLLTSLWLKETFKRRGIGLHVCDLVPEGGDTDSTGGVTLSSVVLQIQNYVDGLRDAGDNRKIRLIGFSVGATAAAIYAEQARESVQKLFLLSPVFNIRSSFGKVLGGEEGLRQWEAGGSIEFSDFALRYDIIKDAESYNPLPQPTCSTYIVHGIHDAFSDLESSVTFLRAASVDMRPLYMDQKIVARERRMLEINDDHSLEQSIGLIEIKLLEYFDLLSAEEMKGLQNGA